MRLTGTLLALLIPLAALADTLVFKDGRTLEGSIVEEDAETVSFKVKSIVSKFKKADIAEIRRGAIATDPNVPKTGDGAFRASRLAPTGDERVDAYRTKAGKAIDEVAAKKKALQAAAKRSEAQTDAFEGQLKRLKAAEAAATQAAAKWKDVELRKVKKTEEMNAMVAGGSKVPQSLHDELNRLRTQAEAALKTSQDKQKKVAQEEELLQTVRSRYETALQTLMPSIRDMQAAIAAMDAAWGDLTRQEAERDMVAPEWYRKDGKARLVLIEGRATKAAEGAVTLATGSDVDPSRWSEEVEVEAPGVAVKPGDVLVIVAERIGERWLAREVRR
jgi:hypothetical protein